MKKNIILIDYENVQKHDLRPLLAHDVLIKVFHGENQKFTSDFMRLALDFGKEKFELIKIKGQGKNAADFHIAYFIGKLSKEIENPFFHIISKDTGFKPLVDFLMHEEKTSCMVESSIAEIPLSKQVDSVLKSSVPKTLEVCYKMVVQKLFNSKQPKAKKIKTLRNQIMNIYKKDIDENGANGIIQKLIDNKLIVCNNESVIYSKDSGR